MALGGGGVSHLFWVPPVTSGNLTAWLEPGVLDDSGIPVSGGGGGGGRTKLVANTDYYISHDTGNDANNGSVGSPWATLQHAVNVIASTIDIQGFRITLHVVDSASTYAGVSWRTFFGGGSIVFLGNNTTLGNVKIGDGVDSQGFTVGSFLSEGGNSSSTLIWVSGFEMVPTGGPCLDVDGTDRGQIILGEPTFLLASKNKFSSCQANSSVIIGNVIDETLDVSIINGTALNAQNPASFIFQIAPGPQKTFLNMADFTVTGAVTFSRAFAVAIGNGLNLPGTIGGFANVSGRKFECSGEGVIYIDSLTSLPGTTTGIISGIVVTNAGSYTGLGLPTAGPNNGVFLNNLPGIFVVPNASGDNWFEGEAGNTTLTGNSNFGTGTGSLASLTTGGGNTAIGIGNLNLLLSGTNNFALGTNCLRSTTAGVSNIAIGVQNMQSGSGALSGCIGIGTSALQSLGTTGGAESGVIAVGSQALNALVSLADNTIGIGRQVAQAHTGGGGAGTGIGSIFIGGLAAASATGVIQNNTIIGQQCVWLASTINNSTILGPWNGGTGVTYTDIVVITDGLTGRFGSVNEPLLDWNYTQANIFSLKRKTDAQGFQIYKTHDDAFPTVNYERGCLDWTLTSNIFRLASQAGGSGTVRLIAIDGFQKAGAPAAGDLPTTTWTVINDTSGGNTWLVYNNAGTIRKVQLV